MKFAAIDVETANANMASICQIGVAQFDAGCLVGTWSSYLNPEDYFDGLNVSIHGISEERVSKEPKLPEVANTLRTLLDVPVIVSHTKFDRLSLARAFAKYNLEPLKGSWLDSARVVRRAWKELAASGYGLKNVCKKIGYDLKHHDALEDAKASGFVLLSAMKELKLDQKDPGSLEFLKKTGNSQPSIRREGNLDGHLAGETLVFTGALDIPRREAADLAASAGCRVESNVTKQTTLLVVGDQDITQLGGHEKSSKHRKAEKLAASGQQIRIICETDFRALIETILKED